LCAAIKETIAGHSDSQKLKAAVEEIVVKRVAAIEKQRRDQHMHQQALEHICSIAVEKSMLHACSSVLRKEERKKHRENRLIMAETPTNHSAASSSASDDYAPLIAGLVRGRAMDCSETC
jgi:Ser-tRNA(Ala) deacylase AlaX